MAVFATTRWSLVLAARGHGDDARAALEGLCRAYRPAVLACVRAHGHTAADAEDLTQGFFEQFLRRHVHDAADPARGRFRTFLRAALKNFLLDRADAERAARRGGGVAHGPLSDSLGATIADAGMPSPDRVFELTWAVTVLDQAVAQLRSEARATGRAAQFEALEPYLAERPEQRVYVELAPVLGMKPNSVAVAVRRMRERLRELVRAQVADTVEDPAEVSEELSAMQNLLGAGR